MAEKQVNQTAIKTDIKPEERPLEPYIAHPYAYAYGRSTKTLLNDTLYQSLRKCAASSYGNQLAIVSLHENIEKTFKQLLQDVDRFANALIINCDIKKNDVVCIWTANAYFFIVVQYAASAIGAILCPINAYYKSSEVQYSFEKVKPKVLIMPGLNSAQERNVNKFYKTFEEISDLEEFKKNSTIKHIVYIDGDQKYGIFNRNGCNIKTHSAKSFLNEKYSEHIPEKEILKDNTNILKATNGLASNINIVNGNLTNGNHVNGTCNGQSITNGNLTNGKTNGVCMNGNLTNGKTSDSENLEEDNENEKPKQVNGNGSISQTNKKLRVQENNESKVSVVDKLNIYIDPDSPCALFFTSGTTGFPKAATLSHFNLSNNSRFFGERVGFGEYLKKHNKTARVSLPVPIFHAFGAMLGTSTMSTCPVTIVMANYRYDIETTVDSIVRYQCTHIFAVPAMLTDIVNYIEDNEIVINSLYGILTAATTVSVNVVERCKKVIKSISDIQIVYGATESSPIITSPLLGSKLEDNLDNVGVPLDFAEVKLVNKNTKEVVKIGEEGELLTRSPSVFLGYYGDEHQTRKVIQNNWYNTGDLATMDANGKLRIVGRTKELIIRGGANIYPKEVEEVVATHPLIHTAAVCGVPHERLNETICCWVRFRDPTKTLTEREIKVFCKEKMAYFKVPQIIMFVDSFPMTQSGKIQKFKMKEMSCEKLGIKL